MGPGPVTALSMAGGAPDHVTEMREFLKRHPLVTYLKPGQAGVARHTATWLEVDADPAVDGTPVTVSRDYLGELVAYLKARFDGR